MTSPLEPGSTVGILGGGQLGRLLAMAAADLGYRSAIFCPDSLSPAFHVCDRHWQAPYDSRAALAEFADAVDIVTFEFENVPALSLDFLEARVPIRPSQRALATTQDRLVEKNFIAGLGIPVAPYRDVSDPEALKAAGIDLGFPIIAKTRRLGYDGKGQMRLEQASDAERAWAGLASGLVIAEQVISFDREISVVLARGMDGTIIPWSVSENVHQDGILSTSHVPALVSDLVNDRALSYARTLAEALDFVGVMAVEMFVIDETGDVIVNEIAPRVHNSGHWTLDGSLISQFEQHIRAICGLPLADTRTLGRVRMENLIGDDIERWHEILQDPQARLHHYGKSVTKPGRKMGHVTWVDLD